MICQSYFSGHALMIVSNMHQLRSNLSMPVSFPGSSRLFLQARINEKVLESSRPENQKKIIKISYSVETLSLKLWFFLLTIWGEKLLIQ